MPDVKKIVADYLRTNGYDGLCNLAECACLVDDLSPCGEMREDCVAGCKDECDCGDHDWHIVEGKPQEVRRG